MLTRHQQSAAVESRGQTRDDSVRLLIGAGGEGPRRAAEDISGRGFGEGDGAVGVGQGVVVHLAVDVAEGCLRVDCEGLGSVAGPYWKGP